MGEGEVLGSGLRGLDVLGPWGLETGASPWATYPKRLEKLTFGVYSPP